MSLKERENVEQRAISCFHTRSATLSQCMWRNWENVFIKPHSHKSEISEERTLATASSGIASTLLIEGRSLHSLCKIPLNIKEGSNCYFTRRNATGQLMQKASLVVIDEMSMSHKYVFECLDRSLQDVRKSHKLFGELIVLFGGDWRKIVLRHDSREQILSATLKNLIWSAVETFILIKNMVVEMLDRDAVEFATFFERICLT